jgi:bla regulator protein blaR1
MSFLTDAQQLFPDPFIYALGWTVIHSLWQGTFVACLMALILTGLQKKSAEVRYRVAGGALFASILMAVVTFFSLYMANHNHTTGFLYETAHFKMIHFTFLTQEESFGKQIYNYISFFLNEHLFYIVIAWLLGVEIFTMRLIGGFWMVMKIRRSPKIPLEPEWNDFIEMIREQMPFQQAVRIAESAAATVPMVIGWLKPLILLPIGTVNNMSASQVEAIIAHELAHIAGKDYLFNTLQTIAEILFYYHPAIWWISAVIRAERENRCDDAAVELCGNKMIYVKALVSMQELQKQMPKTNKTLGLALSFAGPRKYPLLERVKRVLNQSQNKSNIMEKMTATGLILAIVSLLSISAKRANTTEINGTNPKPIVSIVSDTTPSGKVRQQIKTIDNGKTVEMTVENQQIIRLNIGGKEVLKDDFVKHKALTDKLLGDMPSVMDGKNGKVIAIQKAHQVKVNKAKDAKGNTVIKIDKGDGKPIEMLVKDNEVTLNGKKWVDGEEISYDLPAGLMTEIMDMDEVKTIVKDADNKGDKKMRKMVIIKDKEDGMDLEKMIEKDPDLKSSIDSLSKDGKKRVKVYKLSTQEMNIKEGDERLEAPKGGFGNVLRENLAKDKLIEKDKFFKVELSETKFVLNEQEQPATVFEKYKKLYLEHSGEKDCKNCKFKIVMELKN